MLSEIFISVTLSLNLPTGLLSSMCYVESRHQTAVINHDDGGSKSIGVCQIKLSTAQQMGYKGNKNGLLNPKENIHFAGLYLKKCYNKYKDWARAVTCYNKGHSSGHGGSDYLAKVFNRMVYKTTITIQEEK